VVARAEEAAGLQDRAQLGDHLRPLNCPEPLVGHSVGRLIGLLIVQCPNLLASVS
jgi:hypothetical protein